MPEPITPPEIAEWTAACDGPLIMPKQLNQFTALARNAMPRLLAEREQLKRIELAARVALETCRASMKPLVRDGVHAQTTNSAAEQFAAAWRDLRNAIRQTGDPR